MFVRAVEVCRLLLVIRAGVVDFLVLLNLVSLEVVPQVLYRVYRRTENWYGIPEGP